MRLSVYKRVKSALMSLAASTSLTLVSSECAVSFEGLCSPYGSRQSAEYSDPWMESEPKFERGEILAHNEKYALGFAPFLSQESETIQRWAELIADQNDHPWRRSYLPPQCRFVHKAETTDVPLEWASEFLQFAGDYVSVSELQKRSLVSVILASRVYHGAHDADGKGVPEWEFVPTSEYDATSRMNGWFELTNAVMAVVGYGIERKDEVFCKIKETSSEMKHVSDVLEWFPPEPKSEQRAAWIERNEADEANFQSWPDAEAEEPAVEA